MCIQIVLWQLPSYEKFECRHLDCTVGPNKAAVIFHHHRAMWTTEKLLKLVTPWYWDSILWHSFTYQKLTALSIALAPHLHAEPCINFSQMAKTWCYRNALLHSCWQGSHLWVITVKLEMSSHRLNNPPGNGVLPCSDLHDDFVWFCVYSEAKLFWLILL